MRRPLFFLIPLSLCSLSIGCATGDAPACDLDRPAAAVAAPPPARPAPTPAATDDAVAPPEDDGVEEPLPVPHLVVERSTPDPRGRLRVHGTVEDAKVPATFALRAELGCTRDAKLSTTTTGIAFDLDLGIDELAEAMGCAIDARAGDASLETITVTPRASAEPTSNGLALDDAIGVAAAELEPSAGHVVRMTVTSKEPLRSARVTFESQEIAALVTDAGGDAPASAIFEIPARAWSAAVVSGARVEVRARTPDGKTRSLFVRPSVLVETSADEEGC
jgi:hypothetical protein